MRTLFLWCFLIPNLTFCQKETPSNLRYILPISIYRTELIGDNVDNFKGLKNLIEKWNQLHSDEDDKAQLLLNILYAKRKGMSFKSIIKKSLKYQPESASLINELTEEDIEMIASNSHFMDLINAGILEMDFPFKINKATVFFEELKYYDIKNGEKIGEIGAGGGEISTLLLITYEDLELYINELDWQAIDYIKEKLLTTQSIPSSNRAFVIKGKTKSGKLEGKNLDKIIIRNSFHHFSKKEEMLESIKQSMHPDGQLFIKEGVTEYYAPDAKYCAYKMNSSEIKKHLEIAGFELINEFQIGEHSKIFQYKIKKY